jgi:biotin carboxylase
MPPTVRRLIHLYPGEVSARRELLLRQRDWLRESAVELVVADDWIAASDRALYADAIELPPAEAVAAATQALTAWARAHRVDGILVQTEAALPAGSLALRELSLAGPRPEAALRCVGKHLTRAALAAADLPQPRFAVAHDAAGVRRFAGDHGFPIMLKAVASTMARLVAKVDGDGAIEAAVATLKAGLGASRDVARFRDFARAGRLDPQLDATQSFLVESFAAGDPVETDGFVVAGRARCFGALEQVLTPPPRFYVEGYLLPADRGDADAARIRSTGERAAAALGLDASGFSVELRDDGRAAHVIEVNGRLGEDEGLRRLFERAIGADPFQIAVALALGGTPDFAARGTPRHALAYASSFTEGTVASVPSAAEVGALGVEAAVCVRVGEAMHAPPHPETFPHLAYALASDAASSRNAFADARERVGRLRFRIAPPAL